MSTNASEVRRRLDRFAAAVRVGVTAALDDEMGRLARATVGRMAKDTGDLAESTAAIPAAPAGTAIVAGVAVGSHHAAAQEFGTAHNRPHPAFRPSIRESQERTPGEIARSIRQHFT